MEKTTSADETGGGRVPLVPAQRRMLTQDRREELLLPPVSFLLEPWIEVDKLKVVLQALWEHHHLLRARFVKDAKTEWQQLVEPAGSSEMAFTRIESPLEAPQSWFPRVAEYARGIRLDQGGLFWAFLIGINQRRLLQVHAHHLVSDVFSQFILARDISRGYGRLNRGKTPLLPPTMTMKDWGEALAKMGAAGAFDGEVGLWSECLSQEPVGWASATQGTGVRCFTASFGLSKEMTHALVSSVSHAGAEASEDRIVAATLFALSRWSGTSDVSLEWVVSGRRDLPAGINLSRTVGPLLRGWPRWATVHRDAVVTDVVRSVREQRERIAHCGLGYQVLAHFGRDDNLMDRLRSHPAFHAQVNYVGDLDRLKDVIAGPGFIPRHIPFALQQKGLRAMTESSGALDETPLRIWMGIQAEELVVSLFLHCTERSKVEHLAETLRTSLTELAAESS